MKSLYFLLLLYLTLALGVLGTSLLQTQAPEWIRFYANDFLCMPIVLSICALVVQAVQRDRNVELPLFSIFSLTTFYALYFEWYLPENNDRYTADFLDVVMYFSGALLFYGLQFLQRARKHPKGQLDL